MRFLFLFFAFIAVINLAAGLAGKVDNIIPLDKDLSLITADGRIETPAVFQRHSYAKTPDGKVYGPNQARFVQNAILIEARNRAKKQEPDRLSFAVIPPEFGIKGAVACNVALTAKRPVQTQLTIGDGGWKNPFEVTLSEKGGSAKLVVQFHGKRVSAPVSWCVGEKQHLLVSWDAKEITLYVNGKKIASGKAANQPFAGKVALFIGSRKINLSSSAQYSNVALFKEPLNDAEAAELAASPDMRTRVKMKKVMKFSRFSAFPVNTGAVTVRFRSSAPCKSASAKIDAFDIVKTEVSGKGEINCSFDPALLMPGKYQLKLDAVFTDGTKESFNMPVEICKFLRPKENLQVNTWGESAKTHPQFGVTMFCTRTDASAIDEAARLGVYGTFNFHYNGSPRPGHPEDSAHFTDGKPTFPDPRSPYIQQDVLNATRRMLAQVKDSPVFQAVVVNSEKPTGGSGYKCFDFSPAELERAKKYGLDLTRCQNQKMPVLPMGNLRASLYPEFCPADGVVPENNPLYAYHLDRHSANGGTEVVINDLIAKEILRERPDMLVIQDPLMRRPVLRSYKEVNVAADWVYYENLHAVVNLTERLQAAARGNDRMTVCTMPQFLFKRGSAAPYAGLPTADMFREACLIAVSRPTRIVTFWNAKAALCPPETDPRNIRYPWDAGQTPEELAKMFEGKDWKQSVALINEKKGKVFCLAPGVKESFKELSDTVWYPFGALFPKWRNAPRRVAVVRSFASDLFCRAEWPGVRMPLFLELFKTGVPCDVLFDEDLNGDLSQYDLIVLPQIAALPEKGVKNLLAYQQKGGTIAADEMLKVFPLSGAVILKKQEGSDADFAKRADELLKQCKGDKNSIGYIEGIQILQEQSANNSGYPELRKLIHSRVKTAFRTQNNSLFWNHLQAAGADYLFVVNDLRVPGPIYGQYGKVRENGVAQNVTFEVCNPAFRHAYDLIQHKKLTVTEGKLQFDLAPCGGRIILFTEKELGALSLRCPDTVQGGKVTASVSIGNGSGLVPVLLEWIAPDGSIFFSRSDVVKNGILASELVIPLNAPCGTWKLRVRELAQGQQAESAFQVGKR